MQIQEGGEEKFLPYLKGKLARQGRTLVRHLDDGANSRCLLSAMPSKPMVTSSRIFGVISLLIILTHA